MFISLHRLSSYFRELLCSPLWVRSYSPILNRREIKWKIQPKLNHREQKCIPLPHQHQVCGVYLLSCGAFESPNRNQNEIYETWSLAESNSGNCEIGWFEGSDVFVLQLCGDEMTDETRQVAPIPKSFGKIERIYLNLLLGNIIMFRKWLFHFYSCRQPSSEWTNETKKKAIKFRFVSNWLPECFIKFGIILRGGRKLSMRNKSNNEDGKSISSLLTIRLGLDDGDAGASDFVHCRSIDQLTFWCRECDKWIRLHLQP